MRQPCHGHLAKPPIPVGTFDRRDLRQTDELGDAVARLHGEAMAPFADNLPIPFFLVRNGRWSGEKRRDIAGALNLIAGDELAQRSVMVVSFHPTPGDDRRFQPLLLSWAGIEKPGTLRRA